MGHHLWEKVQCQHKVSALSLSSTITHQPSKDKVSRINGAGEQTRDYVSAKDVAHANILALENEVPFRAYNTGTGIENSVNHLYELLMDILGRNLQPEYGRLSSASNFVAP